MCASASSARGRSVVEQDRPSLPVVAVGASAGGLAALEQFFGGIGEHTGTAYVVIIHLAPEGTSQLSEIIARWTSMAVHRVEDGISLKADHVYVITPNARLTVEQGRLGVKAMGKGEHPIAAIDEFFASLASEQGSDAVGVLLSGTGKDGTTGTHAIKSHGGLVLVQDPEEAEYPELPRNAIEAGYVDRVISAREMGKLLSGLRDQPTLEDSPGEDSPGEESPTAEPEARGSSNWAFPILAELSERTEHDFSGYKSSTLQRRIERRIRIHQLDEVDEYIELLKTRPDEVRALLQDLLISVTGFFRDPEAFEALNEAVIKPLVEESDWEQSIRIWVPACATGEEAYSLSILFLERARELGKRISIQIFATDIDERALQVGRAGRYPEARCAGVSPHLLQRYFRHENGEYRVVSALRDTILFARHDMLKDAPFARLNLMSCRNLLIYLKPETQRRVFEIAYYALSQEGVLFLGQSESPEQAQHLFKPINKAAHIYRCRPGQRVPLPLSGSMNRGSGDRRIEARDKGAQVDLGALHQRMIGQTYAPPSVLINDRYEVVHVLGDVQSYLKVPAGRPSMELLSMVRSELRLRIRTAVLHAFKTGEATKLPLITLSLDDNAPVLQIHVHPLKTAQGEELAVVVFDEIARTTGLAEPLLTSASEPSLRLVSELEDELNHARQQLQVTIEEYDASNEELSTANEELMAMNEELQSTGEELETSKEELQSVNEELTTFNEELHNKNSELDTVNSDLRNLLSVTRIATIFLNLDLQIKRYTQPVTALFNILPADVGRPIDHVTHLLKYGHIRDDARRVLETREVIEHEVQSEEGRWYVVRLSPYQTVEDHLGGVVVTFFDVTDRKMSQEIVETSERRFRALFESARDGYFVFQLDETGRPTTFQDANSVACEQLGRGLHELKDMTALDLVEDRAAMEAHLEILHKEGRADSELVVLGHGGTPFHAELRSRLIDVNERTTVLSVSRDVTARKLYEEGLIEAQRESEKLARLRASFLTNMSHEIRTPLTSIIGFSQLLSRKLGDQDARMAHLIETSGKRLLETINSVLDLARIEAGEMSPYIKIIDVVAEVEETVDLLRPMAQSKGLNLIFLSHFQSPSGVREFPTDKTFLNRIVYNLVGNAIKFTEKGSIKVELSGDSSCLRLTVTDTGVGIDEEFLSQIFEEFKQASVGTSRAYDGTGIGLTLVRHMVAQLDGRVSVASTPGKGSTFRISLPALESAPTSAE